MSDYDIYSLLHQKDITTEDGENAEENFFYEQERKLL